LKFDIKRSTSFRIAKPPERRDAEARLKKVEALLPRGLFLSLEFLELHAVVFEDPLVRRKFAPDSPLEQRGFELQVPP
jgi:hypothetical protein